MRDVGQLLGALLLLACVWGFLGCEIQTKSVSERKKPSQDVDYHAQAVNNWRHYTCIKSRSTMARNASSLSQMAESSRL